MFDYTELARQIHADNKAKGFWDDPRLLAEITNLIHSEITELYEAYRAGNPPSSKIDASLAEEELADIAIRTLDYAGFREWEIRRSNLLYGLYGTDHPIYETVHSFVGTMHDCFSLLYLSTTVDGPDIVNLPIHHCSQWARQNGWDLDNLIQLKLAYNRTRPRKHGKAF